MRRNEWHDVGGLMCWSVAAVAREPRNLEHTFIIISNNITARLTWDEPDSDVTISGYRVVWGQLVQSDPIQMDSAALTKVLSKVRHSNGRDHALTSATNHPTRIT